jgi:periplasmic divalent cation tolerance protein
MDKIIELHLTFPDKESAHLFCREVVEEKLAACCNIYPLQSIYIWQSKLTEEIEYAALLKTTPSKLEPLFLKINARHPYEVPAVTWTQVDATPSYQQWIINSLEG